MFTISDYKTLREADERAIILGGAYRSLSDEAAAGKRLMEHLRSGQPKPDGIPPGWWNYEKEQFSASQAMLDASN